MLAVVMQQGWNGLELGKALEARSRAIADNLPLGMTLAKVSDQAVNIDAAVSEFMMK
ncbi:multidrug efflux pump subunit AcrB, partial [Ancylobacter sp. 3268]|nr:multidrug efflux pump subunit AcrB [Ancylobacter sp. 3268]